jgi:hypothetical protein
MYTTKVKDKIETEIRSYSSHTPSWHSEGMTHHRNRLSHRGGRTSDRFSGFGIVGVGVIVARNSGMRIRSIGEPSDPRHNR